MRGYSWTASPPPNVEQTTHCQRKPESRLQQAAWQRRSEQFCKRSNAAVLLVGCKPVRTATASSPAFGAWLHLTYPLRVLHYLSTHMKSQQPSNACSALLAPRFRDECADGQHFCAGSSSNPQSQVRHASHPNLHLSNVLRRSLHYFPLGNACAACSVWGALHLAVASHWQCSISSSTSAPHTSRN